MKVAVSNKTLGGGHKLRGIGIYSLNLIENLKKIKDLKIQEFTNLTEVKDADVVHYLSFDFFFRTLPFFKKFPSVVTIHDITPLLFPKHYPPGLFGFINLKLQRLSLAGIQAVITDSECSKKDIVTKLGIPDKKIHVVYLAYSNDFKKINDNKYIKEVSTKYKLPSKFALYAGSVNWNKNILNIAKAAIRLNLDICLVGKGFEDKSNLDHPEKESLRHFLKEYSAHKKIHILGYVPTEELVAIYNLALVTLLPSFYEGFGMTILESQACGTPVVTSNVSSMPEVAGDSAILVDPNNIEEICGAIKQISEDQRLREQLVKKGFDNIKRFSWEKTAQETVEIYRIVISSQ